METIELVRDLGLPTLATLHDLNIAADYCGFIHVMAYAESLGPSGRVKVLKEQARFLSVELARGISAAFDAVVPEVVFEDFRYPM